MTIEIIAGTPPGGGQDRAARALAAALAIETTITNVPGRGGGNGWDALASRPGDTQVVSISSPTIITNKLLGEAVIDDTDLTPLSHLCTEYLAFAVPAHSPIVTPDQLAQAMGAGMTVALATARGNVNHVAVGMVVAHVGRDPGGVPVNVFDSARYAVADALAGNVEVAVVSAASVIPELGAGSVRVVATSAGVRMAPPFDDVPTWIESGVDCVIGTWRGLIGPAGLGREHLAFWDEAVSMAVTSEAWTSALVGYHWEPTHLDAVATRRFMDEERVRLADALKGLGHG